MGTDIRVYKYDDLAGMGVEAEHTDVPLAFGSWSGTIDLGPDNYKRLAEFLAPFLKVGTRAGKINPQGKQRGRRPNEYYVRLRKWLHDVHGIDLEPNEDGKYDYPEDLRRQFDKGLEEASASGVGRD